MTCMRQWVGLFVGGEFERSWRVMNWKGCTREDSECEDTQRHC